jgi:plasmid stabilization system protein ParE
MPMPISEGLTTGTSSVILKLRQLSFAREAALATLSENPLMWPSYIGGTRRCVLRRFPFSIIYRVKESNIVIIAFAHGRRRPGYWLNR